MLKDLCYRFAPQLGLTISIDDSRPPGQEARILDKHEEEADRVEQQFRRGMITDGERRHQEVEIWTNATAKVQAAMEEGLATQRFNPIDMMVGSAHEGT